MDKTLKEDRWVFYNWFLVLYLFENIGVILYISNGFLIEYERIIKRKYFFLNVMRLVGLSFYLERCFLQGCLGWFVGWN